MRITLTSTGVLLEWSQCYAYCFTNTTDKHSPFSRNCIQNSFTSTFQPQLQLYECTLPIYNLISMLQVQSSEVTEFHYQTWTCYVIRSVISLPMQNTGVWNCEGLMTVWVKKVKSPLSTPWKHRCTWMISLTPQALEPVGTSARTDKLHVPAGIQTEDFSACSLVTTDYTVPATWWLSRQNQSTPRKPFPLRFYLTQRT
jgi:hypothetical protein